VVPGVGARLAGGSRPGPFEMSELEFGFVRSAAITEAFGAESDRLCEVLAGLDDAAFARASGCPPWTVADLAYHVRMTIGRLPDMLPHARTRGRCWEQTRRGASCGPATGT
jgi:hypothetical protein